MNNIAIFNFFCSKASCTPFCCPFYRTFNVWRTLTINPRCNHFIQPVPFVVGSLPCSERFFSGYSGFPLSSKTNIFKFQFDQESGRRRTTMFMCYLQIVIYLFYLDYILGNTVNGYGWTSTRDLGWAFCACVKVMGWRFAKRFVYRRVSLR